MYTQTLNRDGEKEKVVEGGEEQEMAKREREKQRKGKTRLK